MTEALGITIIFVGCEAPTMKQLLHGTSGSRAITYGV